MITFEAHSDGRILVPDKRVRLRRGGKYRVTLEPMKERRKKGLPLLDLALEIAGEMKGSYPRDLAKNHDHYLYGTPKVK